MRRSLGRWEAERIGHCPIPACARILSFVFAFFLAAANVAAESQASTQVYENEEVGCAVSYPTDWTLTQTYQNAVTIQTQGASRRDTARVVVTWEKSVSAEQAERRIDGLIESAARGRNFHLETISTPDGVLRFWTVLEPPAVPAKSDAVEEPKMILRAGSVLGDGWIVRAEGTAWEDADPDLISEMKQICLSLRLMPGDETEEGDEK